MKEVTVQELKELKDKGAHFQLIDVREPHEFDICNTRIEIVGDSSTSLSPATRVTTVDVHQLVRGICLQPRNQCRFNVLYS